MSSTARSDTDAEQFFDASLFLNKNYVTRAFDFDGASVELELLESACTDFDLTGQVVWPAARLLSCYLRTAKHVISGRKVLELGAGVGLAGLLAARLGAAEVVLTDGNDEVVNLLQRNATRNFPQTQGSSTAVSAAKLDWTDEYTLGQLKKAHPDGFDLIVGSDIVFWQQSVPALFSRAVKELLRTGSKEHPGEFILCYQSRALAGDNLVDQSARDAGLEVDMLDPHKYMADLPSAHLRLLRYCCPSVKKTTSS